VKSRRVTVGVLLAALLMIGSASGRDEEPEISEKEVRQAIATFMKEPLGPSAKEAGKKIALFVIQSKDVVVIVGKEDTAWLDKKVKHGGLLVIAYLAGSAQSQLDTGVVRHDPHSALLAVFRLYRTLRQKDKKYRVAEVERLLALHRDGKLMKHLVELQEKAAKKAPAKGPPR
jgi:hypothetical protein